MGIRETHTLASHTIDVGCRDLSPFRVVDLNVSVAQVIRVDDNDIGVFAIEAGEKY